MEDVREEVYWRSDVLSSFNLLRDLRRDEACVWIFSHVARFHSDFQIKSESMELITDIKAKIASTVESLYQFNTSQAARSIGRNASRAQELLAKAAFIHRVYLISSHLQSTEHGNMVHRISTLTGDYVIHIKTP